MSKTDNTDPYWVKTYTHTHRVARHGAECEHSEHWYGWSYISANSPCDIEFARYHRSNRPTGYRHVVGDYEVFDHYTWSGRSVYRTEHRDFWTETKWLTPGCDYVLPDDNPYRCWYIRPPKHRDIKERWNGPARNEKVRRLRDAVKDYNTNGDVEHPEFDHQQHRHGISWYWY